MLFQPGVRVPVTASDVVPVDESDAVKDKGLVDVSAITEHLCDGAPRSKHNSIAVDLGRKGWDVLISPGQGESAGTTDRLSIGGAGPARGPVGFPEVSIAARRSTEFIYSQAKRT